MLLLFVYIRAALLALPGAVNRPKVFILRTALNLDVDMIVEL